MQISLKNSLLYGCFAYPILLEQVSFVMKGGEIVRQ